MESDVRAALRDETYAQYDYLNRTAVDLVRMPTDNPPSDTSKAVEYVAAMLRDIPGVTVKTICVEEPRQSLLAVVQGAGPGKRLLFNGHLDTFCLAGEENWTVPPYGGLVRDGKLYGLGVADMKAGSASLAVAFMILARHRQCWNGELVLSLVGDEESGGWLGTGHMLATEPCMAADAAVIADIGSSRVLRFGEKGRARIKISAVGKAGHGAHVHKTENAVDTLLPVVMAFKRKVESIPVSPPEAVKRFIEQAGPLSESFEGKGETTALQSVTANIGVIHAGTVPNLVPGYAEAVVDVRLPAGTSPDQVTAVADELAAGNPNVTCELIMRFDPLFSEPDHEIFNIVANVSEEVWQAPCVRTMRMGGSDGKHTRRYGIPTVNCGVQGANMGAPDEYVDLDDLHKLLTIHTLAAFDYLRA